MTQQLLDHPEVRPAIEQVAREGVSEGMGRDSVGQAGTPDQPVDPLAHASHAQSVAVGIEEQGTVIGRRGSLSEPWPPGLQPLRERIQRRGAEEAQPLRASLAEHPDLASSQVQVPDIGTGQFGDPEARPVGCLDDGPVTQLDGWARRVRPPDRATTGCRGARVGGARHDVEQ